MDVSDMRCCGTARGCRRRAWLVALTAAALIGPRLSTWGDDSQQAPDEGGTKAQREARLVAMRDQAAAFTVGRAVDGRPQRVTLRDEPVFRYADQPRGFVDATLWCWETKGRPVALSKVEAAVGAGGARYWQFCAASLADGPIELIFANGVRLAPNRAGVILRPLEDGPLPNERPAGRLRQMKELVARFAGTIHVDGKESLKQEMRRLATPIHRYSDEGSGLRDGVIFGLTTNGTNPDMLIVIELRELKEKGPQWDYGIVKMTYAEVHIRLDGAQVYSSPVSEPMVTWKYTQSPRQELPGERADADESN